MDAAAALDDLIELSPWLEAAAIVDGDGAVVAATGRGGERLARAGAELLRLADERLGRNGRAPTRLEAALREGSVFAVRGDRHAIAARTTARPPSALLFHDLAACLDSLAPPKPRRRRKTTAGA